jgi:hypothetical protein
VDVIVAIRSRVLVPEADHVTQFVDDDAELVAVFADGNGLSAVAAFTYKRTASNRIVTVNIASPRDFE